jgi:hypothetical protein
MIGPFTTGEILLVSADASPDSQREESGEAGRFFPGGRWVGAVRNSAERTGCDFLIVTTEHGFVSAREIITPYDFHIDVDPGRASRIWERSFGQRVPNDRHKIMIFYAGGCPREAYLEIIIPLFHSKDIGVLTFGRPNMYDVGMLDQIVEMVMAGTNVAELRAILKVPYRLEYHPVAG